MRSHFLLVKHNWKSPLLTLLQPRACQRAKEKETVKIALNGQRKVGALEEGPKGKARVRDRPALHDGIPCQEGPLRGKGPTGKENPANILRTLEKSHVSKRECL